MNQICLRFIVLARIKISLFIIIKIKVVFTELCEQIKIFYLN